MDVKHPAARLAPEMVMVLVDCQFVACRVARKLNRPNISRCGQLLDVAVDGGQPKCCYFPLGFCMNFRGKKRAPRSFQG